MSRIRSSATRQANRLVSDIRVEVHLQLNAQETVLLDRLLGTGLYGNSRQDAIKRLLDRQLYAEIQASLAGPPLSKAR